MVGEPLDLLRQAPRIERLDGVDDPGVEAAKEMFDVPVIGISEAAFHAACLLGRRFGIVSFTAALANATSIPVIASGGIHNLGDIQALLAAKAPGIIGAITGRAIYEGTLDVAEAQALCDSYKG